MSILSSPGSADLARAMNVVGKNIKTSPYRFYNWNIKIPKNTTQLPNKAFQDLSRAAQFYREGYYSQEQIKEMQKSAREANKKADDIKNTVDKVKQTADKAGKVTDALQKGK